MKNNVILQKSKKPFLKRFAPEIKAYSLIAIPMLWWVVFFVVAFVSALVFSFTNLSNSLEEITKFTFDNYLRAIIPSHRLYDEWFYKSLGVTLLWTVAMLLGNNVMGLLMSFLLTTIKRGRKLFLALLFWPSLISAVVGADLAKMIFSENAGGLANKIVAIFGKDPVNWLNQPATAMFAIMITPFLLGFCVKLLIYYSSIISVPETYYEAARLETSSNSKMFFKITMPLIRNAIILNVIMSVIEGIKVLGPMQLVTKGGPLPDYNTRSVVLYIYQLAFERPYMGRASAYSFLTFIIILVFTIIQLFFTREGDNYA